MNGGVARNEGKEGIGRNGGVGWKVGIGRNRGVGKNERVEKKGVGLMEESERNKELDGKEATKEKRDEKERRGGIREEEIGGNGGVGRNGGVRKEKGVEWKGREVEKWTRREGWGKVGGKRREEEGRKGGR